MRVKELMQTDVLTVPPDVSVERLLDVLTAAHVHAAPVVDENGMLIGMVSEEDIVVGGLTAPGPDASARSRDVTRVREIMTAPPLSVTEDVDVESVARMMWRFRIRHVPVQRDGRVVGIVSSLDFCRLVASGREVREGDYV